MSRVYLTIVIEDVAIDSVTNLRLYSVVITDDIARDNLTDLR